MLLVARIVDARDHLRHAVALACDLADDQVVLVVARDAEDELGWTADPRELEHVQLGCVAEQHLVLELLLELLETVGALFDQRHLVPHGEHGARNVRTDLAAARDDGVHQAVAPSFDSFFTAAVSAEIAVCVGQIVRMPRAA